MRHREKKHGVTFNKEKMSVRERVNCVLWTCLHQGRTETITRQSKSNQGMQPWNHTFT